MSAWISVVGIYNHRPDIFDGVELPTTADLVNDKVEYLPNIVNPSKDDLINNILFELGELELLYADPDFLKNMITLWARLEKGNWVSMWETMLYKYNPIWNKDGEILESREVERSGSSEEEKTGTSGNIRTLGTMRESSSTETGEETSSGTSTGSGTEAETGTVSDAGTSSATQSVSGSASNSKTVNHNVTGFDTNAYSPNTQDVETGSGTSSETTTGSGTDNNTRTLDTLKSIQESGSTSGSVNDSRTGSGTVRDSGTIRDDGATTEHATGATSGTETEQYQRIERGNIGVTMTQDMISRQREIVEFNLYRYITDSFKRRFCLMVY